MPKICSVEWCDRPVKERGLCGRHYHRYQRYGDPLGGGTYQKYKSGEKCLVDGCDGITRALGYCGKHLHRVQRHGDPTIIKKKRSDYFIWADRELATREYMYSTWLQMIYRCYKKTHKYYKDYGGRGIKVCARWLEKPWGFRNFMEDMGERPSGKYPSGRSKYSLDRIDNDGDYCPENCRWATSYEQSANRRNVKKK